LLAFATSAAEAALRDGGTHCVLESLIEVQKFVPHHAEQAAKEGEEDVGDMIADDEQESD
jgi:hypothetical protein